MRLQLNVTLVTDYCHKGYRLFSLRFQFLVTKVTIKCHLASYIYIIVSFYISYHGNYVGYSLIPHRLQLIICNLKLRNPNNFDMELIRVKQ